MARFQGRTENPGEVADVLRYQEVMFHEPLDTGDALSVDISHEPRQFRLKVEGQALFCPAGDVMEMAAHRPKELLRFVELGQFRFREYAFFTELIDALAAIEVFGDPKQRVQIAQPALAVLNVRLQYIARIAEPLVALVPLSQLRLDKLAFAFHDLLKETGAQFVVQLLHTPDIPGFEQTCPDHHVVMGLPDAIVHGAGRMPDLHAEVPKRIEDMLNDLFVPWCRLVGQQEQQIDIGPGRQFAASISAIGDDAQLIGRCRIGRSV